MMFRLFRRGKKKKEEEKKSESIEDETQAEITETPQISETIHENIEEGQIQSLDEFSVPETSFEERFKDIPKVITEVIPEKTQESTYFQKILPEYHNDDPLQVLYK